MVGGNKELEQSNQDVQNNLMMATAAAANLYNKPGVLPFLSLCSRYPGGPWAGLLQQTIKEKQAKLDSGISFGIQRFVNDDADKDSEETSDSEVKNDSSSSAFSPWADRRSIEKVANDTMDDEDDDINVETDDVSTPVAPKKPSIFSVSSLLSNDSSSSKESTPAAGMPFLKLIFAI